MKRRDLPHALWCWAFAFAMSSASIGCLATGLDLYVEDFPRLILLCGGFSLIFTLLFRFSFGSPVILLLTAVSAGYLWWQDLLTGPLQAFFHTISSHYHSAYGWPLLCAGAQPGPVDWVLIVLGYFIALEVSWVRSRRCHALLALPGPLAALIATLVVTDTVPEPIWLYLMLLGTGLLLITDLTARENRDQSDRLTAMMLLPVAATLALLFLAVPEDSYVNHFETIQTRILDWFYKSQSLVEDVSKNLASGTGQAGHPDRLDLRTLGPRQQWDYTVMEVTAPIDGTLYLRGQDYNTYGGSGWVASRHRTETFCQGTQSLGTLKIRTRTIRDQLYVPYYPIQEVSLRGGAADNPDNRREYTFELAAAPEPPESEGYHISLTPSLLGSAPPDAQYRQLPADTTLWANPLAQQITGDARTTHEMAQAIADYVRQSASYDLNTPSMDTGASDFAQWFLEHSGTGYCVHFATAATVLLRASGIPARYVEGYMVTGKAGEPVEVSALQAHAWAEYYSGGIWQVLEATPADPAAATEPSTEAPAGSSDSPTRDHQEDTIPPSQSTLPAPSAGNDAPESPEENSGPGLPPVFACILLILAALWLQSALRIRRRRRQWQQGNPNRRALTRYAQLERMARLLKTGLPEEVEDLARKARFSQHTLTAEELRAFDRCRESLSGTFRKLPPLRRLLYRLVWAMG